jgi:O-antigen/teichoic acid export membrane protein
VGKAKVAGRSSYREGISFGAASFVASALLGLVSTVAIARAYGVRAIGDFALCLAPVNAAWFLSTVKERPGFIRELAFLQPRAPRVTALFWAVFAFSFSLTFVVALLAIVATYFVFNGPIDQPQLVLPTAVNLLGYLFITNTCFNFDTLLSGFRAGRQLFVLRQHQALMFLGVGVAFGLAGFKLWGLIAATIISWSTGLIHRLVIARQYLRARISRAELRDGFRTLPDILRFGIKVAPGGFADGISNEGGTWILGSITNVVTVGAYNRAWNLGRRFMEINFRLSEMLFPTLIERRAKGDHAGFDRALVDTVRYSAVGMLWPAAAAGGAAVGVMRVFGHGFTSVSNALILILLMPAASNISSLQRHTLMSLEKAGLTSYSAGLRMVVTISASITLTLLIGPTGTALAVILGFLADSTFMQFVTRRHLSAPLLKLWPLREIAALVCAYGVGFATSHFVYGSIEGYGGLLIALIVGSLAYAGTFLALGGMNDRDRARGQEVLAAYRKRRRQRAAAVAAPASAGAVAMNATAAAGAVAIPAPSPAAQLATATAGTTAAATAGTTAAAPAAVAARTEQAALADVLERQSVGQGPVTAGNGSAANPPVAGEPAAGLSSAAPAAASTPASAPHGASTELGSPKQDESPARHRRRGALALALSLFAVAAAFGVGKLTGTQNPSKPTASLAVEQSAVSVSGAATVPAPPALKPAVKPPAPHKTVSARAASPAAPAPARRTVPPAPVHTAPTHTVTPPAPTHSTAPPASTPAPSPSPAPTTTSSSHTLGSSGFHTTSPSKTTSGSGTGTSSGGG